MTRCNVCGRPLRSEESVAAGIGPWCKHVQQLTVDEEETARLREQRRLDPDGTYRHIFKFRDDPQLRQLRRDLLDALSSKDWSTCSYEREREVIREALTSAIERAEAYGGASLEMVAMLAVVGIEQYTQGKDVTHEAATA